MTPHEMQEFYRPLHIAVFAILERAHEREWTTQGLGMLRTYLDRDKVWRLNIWHDAFRIPGVSTIHDHPWHFDSWVLAGLFKNQRMRITGHRDVGMEMNYFTIRTGVDHDPAKDRGKVEACNLISGVVEEYHAGDYYHQDASEIHETTYLNGAVTINRRTRIGTGEHARVFWPRNEEWVDAKPKIATPEQISRALDDIEMRYEDG